MRRRPPTPTISLALLQAGEERADEMVAWVAVSLRDADPVEPSLDVRLAAIEAAAIRVAGGNAELIMATMLAGREAATRIAGEEGLGLLDRVRIGDRMVAHLVQALHRRAPPSPPH